MSSVIAGLLMLAAGLILLALATTRNPPWRRQ